ncbi:MAG: hypothetical protein MPK31_03645 [Gammaproteobacteria bacterium]|nr:hypothetical protein [Gammaproteobacteria bacterium]MDA7991351.1 hypothetical protein [Gammaproteobacteria bacterium]MDA8014561.1 hypothetical protein [Gammaproteobacteria bacterium]
MPGEFKAGAVLHYRDYPFKDGSKKNKFLVAAGAKPGCNWLCVLATSKQHYMRAEKGCHLTPRAYFFIPGDSKNFFWLDTWLTLSEPRILSLSELMNMVRSGVIEVKANLGDNITGEIRNCLQRTEDISEKEKELL